MCGSQLSRFPSGASAFAEALFPWHELLSQRLPASSLLSLLLQAFVSNLPPLQLLFMSFPLYLLPLKCVANL